MCNLFFALFSFLNDNYFFLVKITLGESQEKVKRNQEKVN